jgi:RND superfamily putative drug exporter
VLDRLARGVARHPLITVLTWLLVAAASVVMAAFGVTGQGLFDRVLSGAPASVDSESTRADEIIAEATRAGESLTLIVSGVDLADPAVLAALTPPLADSAAALDATAGIAAVVNPLILPGGPENPAAAPLIAVGGDGLIEVVEIEPDLSEDAHQAAVDAATAELEDLAAAVEAAVPGASTQIGGGPMITEEIVGQMEKDLTTGELVSLPIAFAVMIVIFAGVIAACLPLLAALAAIASALGVVFAMTYMTDVHTSVINVITIIGVGLSVDYGLLIVSRFREELRALADTPTRRPGQATRRALQATMATAGRTVAYSALTIAASIAGLIAFKPNILRIYGGAGFAVVIIALLTALTLVPACLMLLGPRVARPSPLGRLPLVGRLFAGRREVGPETGVFSRLASGVQRRPWAVIVGVLAVLTLLAWPLGHSQMRNSAVEFLPRDSAQRQWLDTLEESYPASATPPITLVSLGDEAATRQYAEDEVAALPAVTGVTVVARDGYTEVQVRLDTDDDQGTQAREAVAAIRGLEPGFEVLVTGPAGRLVDFMDQLGAGAPLAAAIIVLATLLLLFAMTGSVLIPIKALATNVLSLAACLGVVTWLFQDGHLSGLLGFDPLPGIESYIVVLLVIFGFGLAMDYEVFLISRVKEGWDAGLDSDAAVRYGLQRSGRIITSAALIIVVVFAGFAAGELIVIKQVGVGLAIAVALDASLVRMCLVPATMTVLGRWNWWSPRWLGAARRRLHLSG